MQWLVTAMLFNVVVGHNHFILCYGTCMYKNQFFECNGTSELGHIQFILHNGMSETVHFT